MINLLSSKYDLSRRVVSYTIPIFSFKEFLLFKYKVDLETFDLKYLLENHIEISRKYSFKVSNIMFQNYLTI
jgi:predicted AAA+ superfamily ATPase